jgi:hypothetical protein
VTLSRHGQILIAEEGESVTIRRDRKNDRWLLWNADLLDFESVTVEIIACFDYTDGFTRGGHIVIPDEDLDSFTAALRDALVEVTVKP